MHLNKKAEIKYARFQTALNNAHKAAAAAQVGMADNPAAFDCGFAWAIAHDLAFMGWCRKKAKALDAEGKRREAMYYGSKNYSTGWQFWTPGDFNGQSIGVHEAGAKAFAESLSRELGFRVEMGSRLD